MPNCIDYYLNLGYDPIMAEELRQEKAKNSIGSYEVYINKYGYDLGTSMMKDRVDKRKRNINF